jgi:hypothetical protein
MLTIKINYPYSCGVSEIIDNIKVPYEIANSFLSLKVCEEFADNDTEFRRSYEKEMLLSKMDLMLEIEACFLSLKSKIFYSNRTDYFIKCNSDTARDIRDFILSYSDEFSKMSKNK